MIRLLSPSPMLLLLLLLLTLCSPTTATAIPGSRLFQRQNNKSCPVKGHQICGNGFPDNFCCPPDNDCIALAGDTTVLCCPKGSTCERIRAITCNIKAQDPEQSPKAPVKTTVFDVDLEKCGNGLCCPFGYECTNQGNCEKKKDQSIPPKAEKQKSKTSASTSSTSGSSPKTSAESSAILSTATATTTSSSTTVAAPAAVTTTAIVVVEPDFTEVTLAPVSESEASTPDAVGNSNDKTNQPKETPKDPGPDTAAVVGGVIGGCAVFLFISSMIFICIRRHARHPKPNNSPKPKSIRSEKSSRKTPIISDPIVPPNQYRADFIRTQTRSATPGSSIGARQSIPNPFISRSSSPEPSLIGRRYSANSFHNDDDLPMHNHILAPPPSLPPIRDMKPSKRNLTPSVNPFMESRRSSAGSIYNVFADPKGERRGGGDDPDYEDDYGYNSKYDNGRYTRFTDLLDQADLSGVGRTKPYVQVPGATPRI